MHTVGEGKVHLQVTQLSLESSKKPIKRSSSKSPRAWIKRKGSREEEAGAVNVKVRAFAALLCGEIVSYNTWKKRVYKEMETKALHQIIDLSDVRKTALSSDFYTAIVNEVLQCSLKHTKIVERVEEAWERLRRVVENDYLHVFIDCKNPHSIWSALQELEKPKQNIVTKIMGGKEAKRIIFYAGKKEKKFKGKCETFVSKIAQIELRTTDIRKARIVFQRGFDSLMTLPIYLTSHQDILKTLATFWKSGTPRLFLLKDALGAPPESHPEASKAVFLKWVIHQVQTVWGIEGDVEMQTEAFLKPFSISKEDLSRLKKYSELALKDCTEGNAIDLRKFTVSYNRALEPLESNEVDRAFHHIFTSHSEAITTFLPTLKAFQEKRWKDVATILVGRFYLKIRKYELVKEHIHILSILKALSSSSFESVNIFLQTTLCPKLFERAIPALRPSSTPHTFQILKGESAKAFTVVQSISFTIYSFHTGKSIGEMHIVWKLHGSLDFCGYMGELKIPELSFYEGVSLQEREEVMECFTSSFEPTPWKDYLSVSHKGQGRKQTL